MASGRWKRWRGRQAARGCSCSARREISSTSSWRPPGPYTDVDVSVKFKPISGREDASGGIIFRFADGRYYVVRANALEDNFRLYANDRGRRQLASASVKPPALGQWHSLRVVAVGDHMQAWLNGALYLDHRDARFKSGRIGLWTKADSVTAFDDLVIRGTK